MKATTIVVIAGLGLIVTLAIVLPIVLILPQDQGSTDILVTVNEGPVLGIKSKEAGIFWGIPFSQPPVNEYRWRNPRDPVPFPKPYWDATFKRPGCPQLCDQPASEYSCPHATDEDCLYLNVWIPDKLLTKAKSNSILDHEHYTVATQYLNGGSHEKLPVMIWFYGGNFLNGAGSCVLYDGRKMASLGDVIVVTTNYRVAHLGFLVQGNSSTDDGKGNFGIWDQIKTMEWVQRNIENFGGNPSQVTLFGQSAGAESVGVHLTSKYSDRLFHQAIMQSNPFGLPFRDLPDAQEFGGRFAEACNCPRNDMVCLRSKTLRELETAFNKTALEVTDPMKIMLLFQPWSPVIDGELLPDLPIRMFMRGEEQKKPMLLGATVDEGMIFVAEAFPRPVNDTAYEIILRAVFKRGLAQRVLEQYPPTCNGRVDGCDNREMLNKLATDVLFVCPQRNAANSSDGIDQWWYIFNQTWSFYELWEEPLCFDRVCHAAELAYIFNVEELTTYTFTADEKTFSNRLMWYWTNFARYGNPNGSGGGTIRSFRSSRAVVTPTAWPSFNQPPAKQLYTALHLQAAGDSLLNEPYEDICSFWDTEDAYGEH